MKVSLPKLNQSIYLSKDWNIAQWTEATPEQWQQYADDCGWESIAECQAMEGGSPIYIMESSTGYSIKDKGIEKLASFGWRFEKKVLTRIPKGAEVKIAGFAFEDNNYDNPIWGYAGPTVSVNITVPKSFRHNYTTVKTIKLELSIDALANLEYELTPPGKDSKKPETPPPLVESSIERFQNL